MTKEILKNENIREDLLRVIQEKDSIQWEWRLCYIVPCAMAALVVCFAWPNVWLGLAAFLPTVYHIVRLIWELRRSRARKKEIQTQIERGNLCVSEEILSHIAEETVYEPHPGLRGSRATKQVHMLYFESGGSFRIPNVARHYSWSKEYYISTRGLMNITCSGDEFYLISPVRHREIAYVYPCKSFVLDGCLCQR